MFAIITGNSYYIPEAYNQGLNVNISLQNSMDDKDRTKETSARYATAWLDHGSDATDKTYEYVIAVNKDEAFVRVRNTRGSLGISPKTLCGIVRPASWNPYPISDQKTKEW